MILKKLLPLLLTACALQAQITNLSTWTGVQDPAHPLMTSSATPTALTLNAGSGTIPSGTDIGFQSVNGATYALSTAGFAFNPAQSFTIAVDFNFTHENFPIGGLGIGFGIGEHADGSNSAGAFLMTSNGFSLAASTAGRINNVDQPFTLLAAGPAKTGAFFVSYDAATGTVTPGLGTVGGVAAINSAPMTGIQQSWTGAVLFPSLFLRSQTPPAGTAWSNGLSSAVFSNFRILEGAAISAVPEPASWAALVAAAALVLAVIRRRS